MRGFCMAVCLYSAIHGWGPSQALAQAGAQASAQESSADSQPPSLGQIRGDVEEVRFEQAAASLQQLLEAGGLTPAELAETHRLGGQVFASLGRTSDAMDSFKRWSLLAPDASLPSGTSPKIVEILNMARAKLPAQSALKVRPTVRRGEASVDVELLVEADPLGMVSGVRVRYRAGTEGAPTQTAEDLKGSAIRIEAPSSRVFRGQVIALDQYGNEISVSKHRELPAETLSLVAPRRANEASPVWYAHWYPYLGLTVAGAGVVAVLVVQSGKIADKLSRLNENSETVEFSEARAVEKRGIRYARAANASFAVASLAAVATLVCVLTAGRSRPDRVVAPVITKDASAGVMVSGSF